MSTFLKRETREKKCKVTHKTISTDGRKSMSWGNCKTVGVEIGIMDTSKGSLEPVRGSKLPVSWKRYDGWRSSCFGLKTHSDYDQFFSGLENYVLLYPDSKLVYHIPSTEKPFTVAKHKKELGKPYSKISFYLCKDEEYQSSLVKGLADSVSQIYSF